MSEDTTQDGPAMTQHPAGVDDKVEGIIVQTRADLAENREIDARAVLVERLAQAGLSLSDAEVDAAASRL
ncbi:hypothetical protein [Microbacterium sp.]|uniref:hypothetical protein n=1 Tax=Microbacterium sp. TaxID=51671 RepID=UPI003735851E